MGVQEWAYRNPGGQVGTPTLAQGMKGWAYMVLGSLEGGQQVVPGGQGVSLQGPRGFNREV